jgi:hypothetical protein
MSITRRIVIAFLFFAFTLALVFWYWTEDRFNDTAVIQLAHRKAEQYNAPAKDYAVIIDFSRSLLSRRLYLVDLKEDRIVLRSRVSHAFRSGWLYASDLSNVSGSKKSCSGAFITEKPYNGKFGFSMVVRGEEKGVNDHAKGRSIVFHPMKMNFPWSEGCFATPPTINDFLINKIARGRLVYVMPSSGG